MLPKITESVPIDNQRLPIHGAAVASLPEAQPEGVEVKFTPGEAKFAGDLTLHVALLEEVTHTGLLWCLLPIDVPSQNLGVPGIFGLSGRVHEIRGDELVIVDRFPKVSILTVHYDGEEEQ